MRANDPGFNCTMQKQLDPSIPQITIIPQDISRVILNIFNNAFYAVDERKKSGEKNYQPTVSITTQLIGKKVRIAIHDNGKGIAKDIRTRFSIRSSQPNRQDKGQVWVCRSVMTLSLKGMEEKSMSILFPVNILNLQFCYRSLPENLSHDKNVSRRWRTRCGDVVFSTFS